MEKGLISLRADSENHCSGKGQTDFICGECGEEFTKPLLAKIFSQGPAQAYYACPCCLTKVTESKGRKSEKSEEVPTSVNVAKNDPARSEENENCNHFFGYLNKRPKETPIPEDCLTCEKMIECMIH